MTKWVYTFGDGAAEGHAGDRNLLGGKGANLAEMCRLGLPVPPGFTITSDLCNWYYANGRTYPSSLAAEVSTALDHIGSLTGRRFGDPQKLLLVSVRSGARASMPGMMDTVLNLGLNDETVEALAADAGDARFAYDSYRRFIQMYSDVVMGLDHEVFEEILEEEKARLGQELDTSLSAKDWQEVIALYKAKVEEELGKPFPAGPPGAALGGDRRRVFELDESPRHHLQAAARHSRKLGYCRQRAGHGLRQHGRHLGDGRRLHAQSVDRRKDALRRISRERPGRGRGRRHPHAAEHHRSRAHRCRLRQAVAAEDHAGGVRILRGDLGPAGKALPRHAGSRIYHRARQALDAADAIGQTHRQGGAEDRRRYGGRGVDHARRRRSPASIRARSTNCCIRPSIPRLPATSSP